MGIDNTGIQLILKSGRYVKNKKNMLTLGRQGIHISKAELNFFLDLYKVSYLKNRYDGGYCENLFKDLGFENIDSIDNSNYEDATIIHNLNFKIPDNFKKYDYIFDGGTSEHIFNIPQLCENIINLLNIGGIYVLQIPNNNLSGHGMYQFSPEFYLSVFNKKYGMEIREIYLALKDTKVNKWINVNSYNGYRNLTKFNSLNEVNILAIIEKVSDNRENLIENPPNQFNYESIEWKKN